MSKDHYGTQMPGIDYSNLQGTLIVVEGPDCSGRSSHIHLLKEWLEASGHAVLNTGLKRSVLISSMISKAKNGNILGKKTLSLMYATDFADQLENKIIPALRAGYVVLADRYIFTLMARDLVRGADKQWLRQLFSFALKPDLIFYMDVDSQTLLHRAFQKYGKLDYWESGMDLSLSNDIFESYTIYNNLLRNEYRKLTEEYGFIVVDATDSFELTQKTFIKDISAYLSKKS